MPTIFIHVLEVVTVYVFSLLIQAILWMHGLISVRSTAALVIRATFRIASAERRSLLMIFWSTIASFFEHLES